MPGAFHSSCLRTLKFPIRAVPQTPSRIKSQRISKQQQEAAHRNIDHILEIRSFHICDICNTYLLSFLHPIYISGIWSQMLHSISHMHVSIPFISITGAAKEAVSSPSQRLEKPLIEKPAGSSPASASARLHRQASTREDEKQLVSVAPEVPKCKSNDLKRVFHYFDVDGDGRISPAELQSCMRTLGEELSAADAEAVVQSTDTDGDGLLGIEDFVRLMEVEEEERKRDLREAFGMYEMEGSGCITPKSLKRMLSRLGEKKTTEECKFMITQFDLDGDGVLSFEEFKVMML